MDGGADRRNYLASYSERALMASWLIGGIGLVYMVVSVQLLLDGKIGLSIAFLGYSIGNVGLYMAAK